MMGVGAKRALGLYRSCAPRHRLAAEQGYASAQNNLGYLYANGEGVPQNDIQAGMSRPLLNLVG